VISKFLEGLGEKLAERWIATLFTPALAFWLGGLLAYTSNPFRTLDNWLFGQPLSYLETLEKWFGQQSTSTQVLLIVGILFIVTLSAVVVQSMQLPTLRFLEGYGWPPFLRRWRITAYRHKTEKDEARFTKLKEKGEQHWSPEELDEFIRVDLRLMRYPGDPNQLMPTQLGNILRAAETRPNDKYGLDAVICWPRLWLLLPDTVRNELTEARTALDIAVNTWLWGLLFSIWSVWQLWAIVLSLLVMGFAYRWALRAAEVYGTVIEATFDLYRKELYKALDRPLPPAGDPEHEIEAGEEITQFLWRGLSHRMRILLPK
jgi:hypothetical protein